MKPTRHIVNRTVPLWKPSHSGVWYKKNDDDELGRRINQIKKENKGKDLNKIYYGSVTANEYIKALKRRKQ